MTIDQKPSPVDQAALGVLAHGLLNSLAAVKGAAEVLAKRGVGAHDPVDGRCLAIILEQAQSIADVLHDLMGASVERDAGTDG